ncbi:MAG: gamma-glutamyltransferase, partial [Acidobacteria bacterium]
MLAAVLPACAPRERATPEAAGPRGALATPEPHATEVGRQVLARGGNAIDAAIAVHFALAVTFPYAGNLGGGGFAVLAGADGPPAALDFRETAPAAAHPALFLDERGEVIAGLSLHSPLAAGVPGSVRGMAELHARGASLPWDELLAPAIALARDGFVLDPWTARSFDEAARRFAAVPEPLRAHLDFAQTFRGRAGETFRQPELAATLERIAREGPDEFYRGETARLIVAEMRRGGGLITADDLAAYRAVWREPLTGRWRGRTLVTMPPPSSGGVALLQLLGILERLELPPPRSAARAHLFAEIEKRVFADRSEYLGDPDFVAVPVAELLAPDYLERRAAEVRAAGGRRSDPASIAPGLAAVMPAEGADTLHFSVIDAAGRAVAVTTTINAGYGSGIVVDGAGFLLNNEMDDFAARPGVPNLYGVTGGAANRVEGGKRPLSSMTPTIVLGDDGAPRLALGSPGGPTIFTTVFQVLVHRFEDGMPLADAVAAPRVHHQWPPRRAGEDALYVERDAPFRLPAPVLDELRALGYHVVEREPLGNVQAVERDDADTWHAVADPRGIGTGVVALGG